MKIFHMRRSMHACSGVVVTFFTSTLEGNSAAANGGGAACRNCASLTVTRTRVLRNSAAHGVGGGLLCVLLPILLIL